MQFLQDQAGVSDAADITSVYYDDPARLPSYHDRLRREDMASVVRLRWYGERSSAPQQRIYVERKVHRERFAGEKSYKERAPIEQQYVEQYTAGVGGPPDMFQEQGGASLSPGQATFLRQAQAFLVEQRQSPILRTCYRRTAFQESSNNLVRISLDADLFMVREAGAPRLPGDWCR
jgi:SPX domain protein involved in polyphosphate accumulation